MRKPRKSYTLSEKVAILRRHLIDRVAVSDLCDESHLSPTVFYTWQKTCFENGAAVFERKTAAPASEHVRLIAALPASLADEPEFPTARQEGVQQLQFGLAVDQAAAEFAEHGVIEARVGQLEL